MFAKAIYWFPTCFSYIQYRSQVTPVARYANCIAHCRNHLCFSNRIARNEEETASLLRNCALDLTINCEFRRMVSSPKTFCWPVSALNLLLVTFEFWQVTSHLSVCYDDANNHTFQLTVKNETYANTDPSERKMAFSWWESKSQTLLINFVFGGSILGFTVKYDVLLACKDYELFPLQSNLFRLCNFCALKQNHL